VRCDGPDGSYHAATHSTTWEQHPAIHPETASLPDAFLTTSVHIGRMPANTSQESGVSVHKKLSWAKLATPAVALAILAPGASAQRFAEIEADPNLPVKEGFDTDRAMLFAEPNFVPFRDPEFGSLRSAMLEGDVADDTPVLAFEAGGQTLVFITEQMAYHHVAQGTMRGEPWMVTF
jgi:hypothetical protein